MVFKMSEKVILDVLNQIEGRLLWLILKLILAGIILLVIKSFIESMVAYILLTSNKHLGIGVPIKVRGVEGKIVRYGWRMIFVETVEGEEIILTKKWQNEKWTLLNDGDKE